MGTFELVTWAMDDLGNDQSSEWEQETGMEGAEEAGWMKRGR